MKIAAALVLLLAAPVAAQTIYPNSAAARFCVLRSAGATYESALDAALRENFSRQEPGPAVIVNGRSYDSNIAVFADAVNSTCPQYLR